MNANMSVPASSNIAACGMRLNNGSTTFSYWMCTSSGGRLLVDVAYNLHNPLLRSLPNSRQRVGLKVRAPCAIVRFMRSIWSWAIGSPALPSIVANSVVTSILLSGLECSVEDLGLPAIYTSAAFHRQVLEQERLHASAVALL